MIITAATSQSTGVTMNASTSSMGIPMPSQKNRRRRVAMVLEMQTNSPSTQYSGLNQRSAIKMSATKKPDSSNPPQCPQYLEVTLTINKTQKLQLIEVFLVRISITIWLHNRVATLRTTGSVAAGSRSSRLPLRFEAFTWTKQFFRDVELFTVSSTRRDKFRITSIFQLVGGGLRPQKC